VFGRVRLHLEAEAAAHRQHDCAFGQYITVFPALDMVVAHKTVPGDSNGRSRAVDDVQYQTILMHTVSAYCGKACRE